MIFIDTNVLLYAAASGGREEGKRLRARSVLAEGGYATSAQVHAEFYDNATRKLKPGLTHAEAIAWLDDFSRFPVVPVTADLVRHGASFAERCRLSYWDGAIIAAAHAIGAGTLYSEDLNDGQLYGSVRVLNPFVK